MTRKSGPVSERVIQCVAATTDRDELDLPPLYDAIDPDTLDAVVSTMSNGELTFTYAGHEITVDSEGEISVDDEMTRGSTAQFAVGET
ncbi:HalOD1 output domain-containing protein [Halobellus captivus]|uniref:HalOD1 output domain-containing protein n=1 Tax=Halobellus captivus TaxID=2592614 RepID=UPI001396C0BE|nr:HalOD1 output domain-containing protein [Halobellus captivus]